SDAVVRRLLEVLDVLLAPARGDVPHVRTRRRRPGTAERTRDRRVARPAGDGGREGQGAMALQADGGGPRHLSRLAVRAADHAGVLERHAAWLWISSGHQPGDP